MTEAAWNACTNLHVMLDLVGGGTAAWLREAAGRWLGLVRQRGQERRLRLFACACMRYAWHKLESPDDPKSIVMAERWADGAATDRELAKAGARYGYLSAAEVTVKPAIQAARQAASEAAGLLASNNLDDPARHAVLAFLCTPLRDIFGPLPFRAVSFEDRWRTHDVKALARATHEERIDPDPDHPGWLTLDPGCLGVLADALEDAGCTSGEILDHLRGPGPHLRGCFAVDLVLGRT
jgi:hypothetical protein